MIRLKSPGCLAWICVCCLFATIVRAQAPDSTLWRVNRTQDFAFVGDGLSPNWQQQPWLTLRKRNAGGAPYQTRMKLLYSDSGIYCLYYCQDHKLTSTLREDFSDLFNEDVVEAFFWTDEQLPMYFEYELSPYNFELPILVPNIQGNFLGWRPWHYEGGRRTRHATQVQRKGQEIESWTAEFFIPFRLLKPMTRVPPVKGTRWRANFYRIDYDFGPSEWSWQQTRVNFHDYERFGTLVFQ
jgi:Carbohydrate family 9 binding domain-like